MRLENSALPKTQVHWVFSCCFHSTSPNTDGRDNHLLSPVLEHSWWRTLPTYHQTWQHMICAYFLALITVVRHYLAVSLKEYWQALQFHHKYNCDPQGHDTMQSHMEYQNCRQTHCLHLQGRTEWSCGSDRLGRSWRKGNKSHMIRVSAPLLDSGWPDGHGLGTKTCMCPTKEIGWSHDVSHLYSKGVWFKSQWDTDYPTWGCL
jgi:hypothetical protein